MFNRERLDRLHGATRLQLGCSFERQRDERSERKKNPRTPKHAGARR